MPYLNIAEEQTKLPTFILFASLFIGGCFALAAAEHTDRYVFGITTRVAVAFFVVTLAIGLLDITILDAWIGGRNKGDGWPIIVVSPFAGAIIGYWLGKHMWHEELREIAERIRVEEQEHAKNPKYEKQPQQPFDVPPQE